MCASKHKPWKSVEPQLGEVPETWIKSVLISREMLPYRCHPEQAAIVPVGSDGRVLARPGSVCSFWQELDEVYEAHRGRGKATPKTLLAQVDFAGKLSAQPLASPVSASAGGRRMVLYPSSGDQMRAARFHAGAAVVENTLFWNELGSEAEAGYLVAMLNAPCLERAFAESRESGRDFHLHPWAKVPIPRFDRRNPAHRRLAALCGQAERVAERTTAQTTAAKPGLRQVGLSAAIRDALSSSDVGIELDETVRRLLPDQAE